MAVPPCACLARPEPIGRRSRLENAGPEGEPVDDRGGEPRVAEGLAPLSEGSVAGHGDGCSLVPLGQDLEKELGTAPVEVQVSELIETEKVQPPPPWKRVV